MFYSSILIVLNVKVVLTPFLLFVCSVTLNQFATGSRTRHGIIIAFRHYYIIITLK